MLAVTSYKKDFVEKSRANVERQLAAYRKLAASAKKGEAAAFEAEFFNTMVLALDHFFLHRQRSLEGKDGNPLNEVRMLSNSILEDEGILTENSTIKYDPKTSISRIAIGDEIVLDGATFERLADGFFDEIERRYP